MLAVIAALALCQISDSFSAGFIQINGANAIDAGSRLDRRMWGEVLGSMKDAGFETVILQQLSFGRAGEVRTALRPGEADDAVESILAEAASRDMAVFVGLWNAGLSGAELADDAYFEEATDRSIALLARIKEYPAYLKYRSFAGWYLPIEPWNYVETGTETKRLREKYLIPLSKACRAVAEKPVALSCYFNPVGFATSEQMHDNYAKLLEGGVIDILLPQDGVGEKGNSEEVCREYFRALKAACGTKVKLWAILECFTRTSGQVRVPCDPDRLKAQFASAHGLADSFVTFDFFHYMNPIKYVRGDGTEMTGLCAGGKAAVRRRLYDGYRELVGLAP